MELFFKINVTWYFVVSWLLKWEAFVRSNMVWVSEKLKFPHQTIQDFFLFWLMSCSCRVTWFYSCVSTVMFLVEKFWYLNAGKLMIYHTLKTITVYVCARMCAVCMCECTCRYRSEKEKDAVLFAGNLCLNV